ncbi:MULTISPECIES: LysE family transporter [Mycobacteriaceae]|uniref:Threonine transporter RhtB n=1 Tax=Mycolicibacterium neoaurum VKM Ac-1815D TaxID=700508 RepID=V5XC88_MYCNE|nr:MULTISPECIES: LysE family transporter [Mycobacteriaceae]AHC25607.1 threonine transporter RhtB [Mycolicibacterium neoaurum VKM Ac-1815D]AMO06054.1 threonine transporter RhtB [Mycolicibacterium neoaurum]AXK75607.1 threonine transporter RhtB [Mycolicibacterium neoaurum]KJQ50436.1 threonine transporter RhtB [Mycolicibacterium neoaurum]KUM09612.1 threonine transporter RhtB [Mycolicibacterium neoaurum]
MTWQVWLAFLGAAIAISIVPGPGAVQSMATGMSEGLRRGWYSVLGLQIGLMLQLVLVAAGVGAIVANSAIAFTVVKWLGVAYLAYLAIRQWRTAPRDLREEMDAVTPGSRRALVLRGFLVNATNPKGLVFFLAALPQFVTPAMPLLPQYLAIGLTMLAVDIAVMGTYTGLAGRMVGWLHNARQQTILNRAISTMFALAAVVLSLVRRAAPA